MNSQLNDYTAMKNYNNSVQEINRKAELHRVAKSYGPQAVLSKQQFFIAFLSISIVLIAIMGLFV